MYGPSGLAWPFAQDSFPMVFWRFIHYHFLASLFKGIMPQGRSQSSLSIFKCDNSIWNRSLSLQGLLQRWAPWLLLAPLWKWQAVLLTLPKCPSQTTSEFRGETSNVPTILIRKNDRTALHSYASLEQGGTEMSRAELAHHGPQVADFPELCTLGHFPYFSRLNRPQANSHCPNALLFKLKFT